jgi:hypothetical protein
MALINPVAGAYTSTFTKPTGSAQNIGILGDDGFELSFKPHMQMVNDTDQLGMTLAEIIYRGADCRLRFRTKEWKQGSQDIFHLFGSVTSGVAPAMTLGIIARKGSDLAGTLVLTSTIGTPAATSPSTLTSTHALLSDNNVSMPFTSKVRELPIELLLLPYTANVANTNYNLWFTTTAVGFVAIGLQALQSVLAAAGTI